MIIPGQFGFNCPTILNFISEIRNPRWLPPQVIVLTQDHMGKYRNHLFSEAIALIEPKLCINHWKVLYKLRVFYVDRNSTKLNSKTLFSADIRLNNQILLRTGIN
jgi:hypothetical protein